MIPQGSRQGSRQSGRSRPGMLNTDIDREGRTPEENAARAKVIASEAAASLVKDAVAAEPVPKKALKVPIARSASSLKDGKKQKQGNTSVLTDNEVWDFITAFQNALEHRLQEHDVHAPDVGVRGDASPDLHELATELLFRIFKTFSQSEGEESSDKHANSLDLQEFLEACDVLCIVPGPLMKKDAIALFKDVNRSSSAADYDQHEMNKYEFVKAIDLTAKRIGVESIEELCYGRQRMSGATLSSEREERKEQAKNERDSALYNVQLGDLNIKMMKQILQIFISQSDDNAAQPELNMEKFVDIFMPILRMSPREIQMLFMKIDIDSDGLVSWNEFSTFVLNLHAKEEAATAADSILENALPFFEADSTMHHEDVIIAIDTMPKMCTAGNDGLICTAGNDGYLRLWHSSTGLTAGGRHVRAVPLGKQIMSLSVLKQSSMVAVGCDDFKIRFFEPYSLRHELTFDCEGQWPFSMVSFMFPDDHDPMMEASNQPTLLFDDPLFAQDKKGFSGWFAWGDGDGELHFMPEKRLVSFKVQHEVVPFFRSGMKGLWDLKVFTGKEHATGIWITTLMFLPDIGIAGIIVAAASNGHVGVISFETQRVFHYYIQHRLSVKSLAWCGRQNNMLASAGLDRDIHLWRPVAIRHGRPILAGTLAGHNAGVTCLVFHEKRDVLFSLDSHSVTLVWDLSSRTLVSKMNPLTLNPFDISNRVKLIMVNQKTRHLITASNHIKYWGVRPLDLRDGSDKLVPHVSEIVITLYNKTFDHLLTGDRNGLISLWNAKTGAQMFKFFCESVQETYGPPVLSAASFDISQRRLILGWNQGTVQIYNFSNGTILRTLTTDTTIKVTAVGQYSFQRSREEHQYFTAAFEDGLLLQWADDKNPSDTPVRKIEVPNWMGIEFSEVAINAMAAGHIGHGNERQDVLVTVRNDGVAFFWDITTGFLLRPQHDVSQKKVKHDKDKIQNEKQNHETSGPVSDNSKGRGDRNNQATVPGAPAAKESLCMQVSDNAKVQTTCVRMLHRCKHIAFISDMLGLVHVVNIATGKKLGSFTGTSRAGRYFEDEDYIPRINAMVIDYTDSFLIAGDEMGELQVWDISQIFDDDYVATMSLVIPAFRWKAHEMAVTKIQHLRKRNVIITSGSEEWGLCIMWTIAGQKIGSFGHTRWTEETIEKSIELGAAVQEDALVEETDTEKEADAKIPMHEKILGQAMAYLAETGEHEKVELSALKAMLHKDRQRRGIQTSIFKRHDHSSWEPPSGGDTPMSHDHSESDEAPTMCGQFELTIEALEHLPSCDRYSKPDPYARIYLGDFPVRSTRTFLNQQSATVNETFLFYIQSLDHRLKIVVWDHDEGGEEFHDLIGSTDNSLHYLFEKGHSAHHRLPLMRNDGTGAGKLGSVSFKVEFQPIVSTLSKPAPVTVSDHIHLAIKKQGVVPMPPIKSFAHPVLDMKNRTVTSIATSRWKTSDFRHLSVYHLHDDLKIKSHGAMTERNTDRTRGARAGRDGGEEGSTADAPLVHRFSKETVAGRLERGLDLAWTPARIPSTTTKSSRISSMQKKPDKQSSSSKLIHPSSPTNAAKPNLHEEHLRRPSLKAVSEGIVHVHGVNRRLQIEQKEREARRKMGRTKDDRDSTPSVEQGDVSWAAQGICSGVRLKENAPSFGNRWVAGQPLMVRWSPATSKSKREVTRVVSLLRAEGGKKGPQVGPSH